MLPFLFYFLKVDESRFFFSYTFSIDVFCSINRHILLLFLYQSWSGSPSTIAEYRVNCSNILKSTDRRGSKKEPSAEAPHVYNVFLTVHAPFWSARPFFFSQGWRGHNASKKSRHQKAAQRESLVEIHSNLNLPRPLQKGAAPKRCPVRKRPKSIKGVHYPENPRENDDAETSYILN